MDKQALRAQMAQQRKVLSPDVRRKNNAAILRHITQSAAYRAAPCVFTYISFGTETDTLALMAAAWADGKQVAVPVTLAAGQMYFVPIAPHTPLRKTRYGTSEPVQASEPSEPKANTPLELSTPETNTPKANPNTERAITPRTRDLFLLPGLAFDALGNRCGYGGGFYDRYLAAHPSAQPIALCYGCQISQTPLETQPHDAKMHAIITEDGWQNISQE